MNRDFWNIRYSPEEYLYGKEVNDYLSEKISKLSKGKILLPADREGRNSVYLAKINW